MCESQADVKGIGQGKEGRLVTGPHTHPDLPLCPGNLFKTLSPWASGVVPKPLPSPTKAWEAESRTGERTEWEGALASRETSHPGQEQRLGLATSWGSRGQGGGALAACLFSTELRFLLGSNLICVQTDLFAVHTCKRAAPWGPDFKRRGRRGMWEYFPQGPESSLGKPVSTSSQ